MHGVIGIERAAVEARARRLAAAVIATHEELDRREREARGASADVDVAARRALAERTLDLATMTDLLPRTHELRLAAEHVARTVDDWAIQPAGTEEARVGSLSMVISIAMLRRAVTGAPGAPAADPRARRSAA